MSATSLTFWFIILNCVMQARPPRAFPLFTFPSKDSLAKSISSQQYLPVCNGGGGGVMGGLDGDEARRMWCISVGLVEKQALFMVGQILNKSFNCVIASLSPKDQNIDNPIYAIHLPGIWKIL